MRLPLCKLTVLTAAWLAMAGTSASAQTVTFLDEFDDPTLGTGWSIVREVPAQYTLAARPGFLRILTQRGGLGEKASARNIFLRTITGDFILDTRIEFDPTVAHQFAGLIIYLDDFNGVAVGLSHASGEQGEFRGVAMINALGEGQEGQRAGSFFDESVSETPNIIYLRVLRSGDQFVAAFSADGIEYQELATFTNPLPDTIQVGLGAGNGDADGCGSECDLSTTADFDYFQISSLDEMDVGDDDPVGDTPDPTPVLFSSFDIVGPDVVLSGQEASYDAELSYSDGSTIVVTAHSDWEVAPANRATINDGILSSAELSGDRQVTIVVTYTDLVQGVEVERSAAKLVQITTDGFMTSGACESTILCGAGMCNVLAIMLLTLCLRWTRSRVGYFFT